MRKRSMASALSALRRNVARLLRVVAPKRRHTPAPPKPKPRAEPKPKPKPKPAPKTAPPPGFSPNPGGLDMHLHIPRSLRPGSALVVLLHGCGQEPQAFAAQSGWLALSNRAGFALLMPGQTTANNSQGCFNWFRPGDIGRNLGEAASIRAMIATVAETYPIAPARIFATGLSAGAAMTACLLAAYPDVFAAGAIVAGLPAGAARSIMGAMTRMAGHATNESPTEWASRARALGPAAWPGPWPRVTIWHGDADPIVAPSNSLQLARQWTALHGITTDPTTQQIRPGVTRTFWGKPGAPPAVELWALADTGHVYPTEPIAAATEIARSWGLI